MAIQFSSDELRCRICFLTSSATPCTSPIPKAAPPSSTFLIFFINALARLFKSFSISVININYVLRGSLALEAKDETEPQTGNELFDGLLPGNELISPCSCSGSVGWVHRACINQWRYSQFIGLVNSLNNSLIFETISFNPAQTLKNEVRRLCISWMRWLECLRVKRAICEYFSKYALDTVRPCKNVHLNWFPTTFDSHLDAIHFREPSAIASSNPITLLRDAILSLLGIDELTEPIINIDAVLEYFSGDGSRSSADGLTPFQAHITQTPCDNGLSARFHPFLNCDLCRTPYSFTELAHHPSGSKKTATAKKWSVSSYLFLLCSFLFLFFFISGLSKTLSMFRPAFPSSQYPHYPLTSHYCFKSSFQCLSEFMSIFLNEFMLDSREPYNLSSLSGLYSGPDQSLSPKVIADTRGKIKVIHHLYSTILAQSNDTYPYFEGEKEEGHQIDDEDHFVQLLIELIVLLFRGFMLVVCGPPLLIFLLFRLLAFVLPLTSMSLLISLQAVSFVALVYVTKDYLLCTLVVLNVSIMLSLPVPSFIVIFIGLLTSLIGLVTLLSHLIAVADSISIQRATTENASASGQHLLAANRFYWNILSK